MIRNELIKLGYNISNIGTLYLVESIDMICNSENYIKMMGNLEANVYIKIAQKYNTSLKTLKSNIVKATNNMDKVRYLKQGELTLSKFTPKNVIYYIVENIINT